MQKQNKTKDLKIPKLEQRILLLKEKISSKPLVLKFYTGDYFL